MRTFVLIGSHFTNRMWWKVCAPVDTQSKRNESKGSEGFEGLTVKKCRGLKLQRIQRAEGAAVTGQKGLSGAWRGAERGVSARSSAILRCLKRTDRSRNAPCWVIYCAPNQQRHKEPWRPHPSDGCAENGLEKTFGCFRLFIATSTSHKNQTALTQDINPKDQSHRTFHDTMTEN